MCVLGGVRGRRKEGGQAGGKRLEQQDMKGNEGMSGTYI